MNNQIKVKKKLAKEGLLPLHPLKSTPIISDKKVKFQLAIFIAIFSFALYINSIDSDYVLDDAAVIVQNSVVSKGLKGIPTLLQTENWYGYSEGIRGPMYRPASMVMFAIEWHFFPNNPHVSHFINVLLYSATCFLLFILLCNLFENKNLLLPFVCTLLYATHPIHTEVVYNIKSRDELLCFFFSIIATLFFLKYYSNKITSSLLFACLFYFLSLLSKESGITFLAVIPIIFFFFKEIDLKKIGIIVLSLVMVSSIYLLIRQSIIAAMPVVAQIQLIDNSLLGSENNSVRIATAFYILLQYFKLLIFPHPLSHDYSFAQISLQSLSSPPAIAAFLICIFLAIYAAMEMRKKTIVAFAIIFFFITVAPVSNIFLLIGSTMAERFMYTPSLAFCIVLALILLKVFKRNINHAPATGLKQFFSSNASVILITFLVAGLFSLKTLARNKDWKDNFTLFTHDIKTSDKSARAHYNLGATLIKDKYDKSITPEEKQSVLLQAQTELKKALAILPDYYDVNRELARNYFLNNEFEKAIIEADNYLKVDKSKADVYIIRGGGWFGLELFENAINDYQKAIELDPKNALAYKNLGRSYAYLNQYSKAIECFQKASEFNSADSENYLYIGRSYQFMGDSTQAKPFIEKAESLKNGIKKLKKEGL
ncbi:MAG: tetratricopeptide repeat protein [Saprospiraceae bacterium]|nr:tetratricopeptide repeat protein [Saprospiraceae bacterium]